MKQFVVRTAIFASLAFLLLAVTLIKLPNRVVKNHMLYALVDKHQILQTTGSPKVIFAGGSSVGYSLDSKRIQDALKLPVVNAGLNANLGMKFYLNDIKPYIGNGDVVVVAPEYMQYYTDTFYGKTNLISSLFDVNQDGLSIIDASQWFRLIRFIPFYAASKVLLLRVQNAPNPVHPYGRKAFNQYGDAYLHWDLPQAKKIKVAQKSKEEDSVNPEAMEFLTDFQKYVESKGARMYLLPPVFHSSSFINQKPTIDKIYQSIKDHGLPIIAAPERYEFPDSLFYDSDYHLRRRGVEQRSDLVIEDLQRALSGPYALPR